MGAPLDGKDAIAELRGHPLGNRQAKASGADDEWVEASGHRLPRVSDRTTVARLAAALRRGGVPACGPGRRHRGWRMSAWRLKIAIGSQFDIGTLASAITPVPSAMWLDYPLSGTMPRFRA
jgi:hypothetical protein